MKGIERIKALAADVKDKPLLKIVEYLLSREDMNIKYLDESKSLKQMIEFIRSEARKQAVNQVAMIEDEEVYGWAIHYWDETNKTLGIKDTPTKKDTSKNDDELEEKVEVKDTQKPKTVSEGQLTLFDICT